MCTLSTSLLYQDITIPLDAIAFKISLHSKLGKNDLNIDVENLFRDIFSVLYETNFINLNEDRPNYPGVDLYSEEKDIAIQVTSQHTAKKIQSTMNAIERAQHSFKNYVVGENTSIVVLMIYINKPNQDYTTDYSKLEVMCLTDLYSKIFHAHPKQIEKVYEVIKQHIVPLAQYLDCKTFNLYPNLFEMPDRDIKDIRNILLQVDEEYFREEEESINNFIDSLKNISNKLVTLYSKLVKMGLFEQNKICEYSNHIPLSLIEIKNRYNGQWSEAQFELQELEERGLLSYDENDRQHIYLTYSVILATLRDYCNHNGLKIEEVFGLVPKTTPWLSPK